MVLMIVLASLMVLVMVLSLYMAKVAILRKG